MKTMLKAEEQFRTANSLLGDKIESKDGKVCGKCRDFLFDDQDFTIRYIVADTGGFLSKNEVLLSPFVFENPEFGAHVDRMPTVLSEEWIEASPPLEAAAPISEQYEMELARHYDYPLYWSGAGLWGVGPYPNAETPNSDESLRHAGEMEKIRRSHLRSCDEINGYEVHADNEDLGKVVDFIVQAKPWKIRYWIVKTGSWFSGKKVIVSPDWTESISWSDRRITIPDFARGFVEGAPAFDPEEGVNRDYEGKLYDYYGRPYYW